VITSFGIDSDDIWNFNETDFQIGVGRDQLVITKQQRQFYLRHPTNRELATAVEVASASGARIPLFLIISGITHQSSWYTNSNLDPDTTIAVSNSSYSNDQVSLDWLHHFEKHTQKLTKGTKRLLFWMATAPIILPSSFGTVTITALFPLGFHRIQHIFFNRWISTVQELPHEGVGCSCS
jgi:hypothetical protein